MNRREWSERRLRGWRWGWGALIAGVLFAPIGQQGSCADTSATVTGDSQCTTSYVPLLGLGFPLGYPTP
ncbi:MAG: hypothetical protein CVT68_00120 [Actinobacteria bacterium HGW-Actinobacteria-8]|nr:MAG: hypothetical protein CVT68_00120 [Actinobacteria bacterium HGW-Actinobacteria-8]